jgi:chromosome segregation ATPase
MTDDSNCHCPICTTMNEPLSLEGDIRYLKAHIETKDRQLADAQLRINIYKEAWQHAAAQNAELREEKKKQHARISELEDTIMRLGEEKRIGGLGYNLGLAQENERLKAELEASRGQVRGQLQIILDLRKEKETLIGDRTSLVEEANELYEKLGRISTIIDEIVD